MQFLIFLFILTLCFSSKAQKIGSINIDKRGCEDYPILGDSIRASKAIIGLEPFLKSTLGPAIMKENLWLQYCESSPTGYQFYGGTLQNPVRLNGDTGYHFQFYLVQDSTVIGNFTMEVDKAGQLLNQDLQSQFMNNVPLLLGFKRHFENKFPFNYAQAKKLGLKKGFKNPPELACVLDKGFINGKSGEVYVKIKYYWTFFVYTDVGHHAILDINAETGKIEREDYIPRMPK